MEAPEWSPVDLTAGPASFLAPHLPLLTPVPAAPAVGVYTSIVLAEAAEDATGDRHQHLEAAELLDSRSPVQA